MKKFIIAFACIVLGYSYSFAQQKTPTVQKGYYSIGNNVEKLEKTQPAITSLDRPTKGYYAMTDKARPTYVPIITIGVTTPPAKGYYTIGDNHKKLASATVIANAEYAVNEYTIH
ncbi:hypothetical protein [Pinibacter soli]|uniref:Uncharacterized protein n=1 Tax=Pinibacter soli TaxID=3044211 RepID=A0ABT6RA58_9BACT|nr:hypothetical protein [Pinibacter soli]MDI3319290.1 hypothetical protein [Pinibacter soli]